MTEDRGQSGGGGRLPAEVPETRAAERLATADHFASVGVLASSSAHEINNSLASIVANVGWLRDQMATIGPRLDPETVEELSAALEDISDAGRAIRDGMERLRGYAEPIDDARCRIDPARALNAAVAVSQHHVRRRGQLRVQLGPVPEVDACEARLAQIFVALLLNAAYAVSQVDASRRQIEVSCRTDERGWALVEVRDTGVGIDAVARGRVCDALFSTLPPGRGTGLGLCVARQVIDGLGGAIQIESQPVGSTIRVLLPPATAGSTPP